MQPCDCLKPTMDIVPGIGRRRASSLGARVMGVRGVGCNCNKGVGQSAPVETPWYSHPLALGLLGAGMVLFLARSRTRT